MTGNLKKNDDVLGTKDFDVDIGTGGLTEPDVPSRFGALVAESLSPGEGSRSDRAYEARVVATLARRAVERAFTS